MLSSRINALFLVLLILLGASLHGRIIDVVESDFGEIDGSVTVFEQTVTVTNLLPGTVTFRFLSGCACLEVLPTVLTLDGGESAEALVRFDTAGYREYVEKPVLILTDDPDNPKDYVYFEMNITGRPASKGTYCEGCEEAARMIHEENIVSLLKTSLLLEYYYSAGCRQCTKFLDKEIPRLREEIVDPIIFHAYDVMQGDNYERMARQASGIGRAVENLPVLFIDGIMLEGEASIKRNMDDTIAAALQARQSELLLSSSDMPENAENSGTAIAERLSPISVFLAGLVDGVNPCVFTTLLFLLSTLALIGKNRREILTIGIIFTLTVFVTYFLAGFGFLSVLRTASAFPFIASLIRWILIAVLFVFAGLSAWDCVLIRRGKTSQMVLQLPDRLKKNIHATIRNKTRRSSLILGTLTMGVLVSIFELACTGQVYLPTIAYMLQVQQSFSTVSLLVIYNIAFIVPLLAVFIVVYAGTTSRRLTAFFQENVFRMKLSMTALFLILAVLTILL